MRLIDGDALKKAIYPLVIYRSIEAYIDNAPTIEERKTGKWIPMEHESHNGGYIHTQKCSRCGEEQILQSNYCPECGSKNK